MEGNPVEFQEKHTLNNYIANKKEETGKRHNLTSLPELLDETPAENNDESSSKTKLSAKIQAVSLSNIRNQTVKELSEETMNKRVYAFLVDMIQSEDYCQTLIEDFKKFEEDVRISVKKSRKNIKDSGKVIDLKSLEDSSEKQMKKKGKERKKVRFQELGEDAENDNISIKMIRSNMKFSKKQVTSIRDIALSLGRLFSFGEMSGEQKTKNTGKVEDMIIEDEQDKLNEGEEERVSFGKINLVYKNPSIMMFEDEESDKDSELFSSGCSIVLLENIAKPTFPLSQEIVKKIFWNCSPFLVNLSLCLMIKCLTRYKMEVKADNICWLLGVATVVAYKIFYDQEIEGLTNHYSKLLQMKSEDLVSLQIWFLHQLNYQIHVTNRQYFQILSKLLA